MTQIGINGFGRIGRLVLRAARGRGLEIVGINDLTDAKTSAHLLKWDSIHGPYAGSVEADGDAIVVDGKRIPISKERDPAKLQWKSLGAEIVIESTGIFTDRDGAGKHLEAGAERVIISAPAKNPDVTIVLGVNTDAYDPAKHRIVSNASCTTNCLAPVAKVLHDNWGIEQGWMTTIHAYTNDQVLTDVYHKDLHRARAAAMNMIPTKTGAAAAVGLVLPELNGKLDGFSMRVPTINVSVVDLTFVAARNTTKDEVNAIMKEVSGGTLKGVIGYSTEPLVSSDFNHDSHSAVFDAPQTRVSNGNLVKVLVWYDNEWGFSNRMLDITAALMAAK